MIGGTYFMWLWLSLEVVGQHTLVGCSNRQEGILTVHTVDLVWELWEWRLGEDNGYPYY